MLTGVLVALGVPDAARRGGAARARAGARRAALGSRSCCSSRRLPRQADRASSSTSCGSSGRRTDAYASIFFTLLRGATHAHVLVGLLLNVFVLLTAARGLTRYRVDRRRGRSRSTGTSWTRSRSLVAHARSRRCCDRDLAAPTSLLWFGVGAAPPRGRQLSRLRRRRRACRRAWASTPPRRDHLPRRSLAASRLARARDLALQRRRPRGRVAFIATAAGGPVRALIVMTASQSSPGAVPAMRRPLLLGARMHSPRAIERADVESRARTRARTPVIDYVGCGACHRSRDPRRGGPSGRR